MRSALCQKHRQPRTCSQCSRAILWGTQQRKHRGRLLVQR